jgi:hypothetical protein
MTDPSALLHPHPLPTPPHSLQLRDHDRFQIGGHDMMGNALLSEWCLDKLNSETGNVCQMPRRLPATVPVCKTLRPLKILQCTVLDTKLPVRSTRLTTKNIVHF